MIAFTNSVKNWLNAGLGLLYLEVRQLCREEGATPAQGYVCGGFRAKPLGRTSPSISQPPHQLSQRPAPQGGGLGWLAIGSVANRNDGHRPH